MSGNAWMYSDRIDDLDLLILKRDFITLADAIDYYGMSYRPMLRTAKEAGAVFKIGFKMIRINRSDLDSYLRKIRISEKEDSSDA